MQACCCHWAESWRDGEMMPRLDWRCGAVVSPKLLVWNCEVRARLMGILPRLAREFVPGKIVATGVPLAGGTSQRLGRC